MNNKIYLVFVCLLFPACCIAADNPGNQLAPLDFTSTNWGLAALIIFVFAYGTVISEEFLHLRKSKPVMVAAGLIWILVGSAYSLSGDTATAEQAVRANILEYGELMLFLLAAMTYINTMDERNVFQALRGWLVRKGYSLRAVFWLTGLLAFFISPFADNLTTSLVMAAVVMSIGSGYPKFIAVSCINIVVAANAGGAFSPFGDITTLMVWQKGVIEFFEFFDLFLPSLVNWLVPAIIMSFVIPTARPENMSDEVKLKHGGLIVVALFLGTIVLAVSFHNFLHLPPMLGMMTGLGLLKFYGFHLRRMEGRSWNGVPSVAELGSVASESELLRYYKPRMRPFDIFISLKRVEWDTLMFFYGVILCVGGLATLGYLALASEAIYSGVGPTIANILVGILSAIVDNIPVMYAVLTMQPDMSHGQWLLVTMTAGVGGSLLSIGSAAGVALMGQARGVYTFFSHLKWSWAVALGYAASIWTHIVINGDLM